MKKNRTSWSLEGAEAMLKVIMDKMNETIKEIITRKAEKKIKEELAQKVPDPKKIAKIKYQEIRYAGTAKILENITSNNIKQDIKDILKGKPQRKKLIPSKLPNIEIGAIVKITDLSGRTLEYKVYDTYVIDPYDNTCTSQLTNGQTEITLITCYNNGRDRFVVKARKN